MSGRKYCGSVENVNAARASSFVVAARAGRLRAFGRGAGVLLAGGAALLLTSCFNFASHGEKEIRYEMTHRFGVEDPQFLRSMGQLLGPAMVPGNRVTAYQNGDEIFPAMLEAIRGAQQSIVFETYIYWSGKIGQEFADAFSERARAGVKVHVLLDWLGTGKIDGRFLDE